MSRRVPLVVALALAVLGTAVGVSFAAFTGTTGNLGSTFGAKRIFPANRSVAAFSVSDQTNGTATDKSNAWAYDDTIVDPTSNWSTAYDATRYLDFDFPATRPTGVSVSAATFAIKFASKGGAGSGNGCLSKVEVRRASTGAVLQTFDLTGNPQCSTGTTYTTYSADISSAVTSTDIVNDLRIRVYGYETGAKGWNVGYARVSVTTPYVTFTAYATRLDDVANAISGVTIWSFAGADTITYQGQNAPASAPVATKYMKYTFEPALPSGATVNSVTFTDVWRPNNAVTSPYKLCNYVEVYNGTTLLGTHGGNTQATAQSCNASNTSYQTDTIPLSEVTSVSDVNNLSVRVYYWMTSSSCGGNPACVKNVTDQAQLTVNYHLN